MAGNNDVDVLRALSQLAMRSETRARYEQSLATAARGLRSAETQLRIAGHDQAADELSLARAWIQSEIQFSLAGKTPLSVTFESLSAGASSRTASGPDS